MKKFLALILTLGFAANAFAGCGCGCRVQTASKGEKPSCYRLVTKKVAVCPQKHISFTCPTDYEGRDGMKVAVHQES
jgi:hypothetical protein